MEVTPQVGRQHTCRCPLYSGRSLGGVVMVRISASALGSRDSEPYADAPIVTCHGCSVALPTSRQVGLRPGPAVRG